MAVQPLSCVRPRDDNNNGSRDQAGSPTRASSFCCCPPLLFGKRKLTGASPPPREPTPILQLDSETPHRDINKLEENGDVPSHKSDFDSVRDVAKSPTGSTASLPVPPSTRSRSSTASPSRVVHAPPTIEDDMDDDRIVPPSPESRKSKPPSMTEERFINNNQDVQTVNIEDENEPYFNEERFINLKQDSPAKDVVDRVSLASNKNSSTKEKLSKTSAHSVKSQGFPITNHSPKETPVRNTLVSAPAISFLGSSVSLEDEVKSMESALSEVSVRGSVKSLSSEENYKPNGEVPGHGIAGSKISPIKKTPKKIAKVIPKSLSSKFTKNKVQPIQNSTALQPIDKPKDALAKSLIQLENADWETVMLGLQSMESLIKHHSAYLEPHLTPVTRAISSQIKNLRSQVARGACRLAGDLFLAQKKALEPEAEELAVPLLHRTADTNKFLRSDANEALDKMCDSISAQKSFCVIMVRGAVHQNAIVRCTSARLLSKIAKINGAEKIFALHKDTRDKLFQTGADLLAEGSLETRSHAKQLFKVLSQNTLFFRILRDVIPLSKYRNIEKALNNIRSQ